MIKTRQSEADLRQKWQTMNHYENALRAQGVQLIAGIDEAGRGPLAGPVAAAAVILPADCEILGLDDSKKLSEKQRLALGEEIREKALAWSVAMVNNQVIDEIGIAQATKQAMAHAVEELSLMPEHLLVDAMMIPLALSQTALIKGDSKSVSIAAASILAKNARDRLMLEYHEKYPQYGFAQHKGYPTKQHKEALRTHGHSPIHRKTFHF